MITVTIEKINGDDVSKLFPGSPSIIKRGVDRLMMAQPPAPSTEGTLSSKALVFVSGRRDGAIYQEEWLISESYNTFITNISLDTAAQGAAPLADPTFTGTPAAPTAADGTNTTQLATTAFVRQEIVENRLYGAATGTDTYALDLTPNVAAYAAGLIIYCTFANTNTGAATINVDALGAKAITKGTNGTTALSASDLVVGKVYTLVYDGTRFQINL